MVGQASGTCEGGDGEEADVNPEKVGKADMDLQLHLGLPLCLLHGDLYDAVTLCVLCMTAHVLHIVLSWVIMLILTNCDLPPKRPFFRRTPLLHISVAMSSQATTQALLLR